MSVDQSSITPLWDRARLLASPFFRALAPIVALLPETRFPTLDQLNALAYARGVASGGGVPLRFVAATRAKERANEGYESRIHARGEVPTRIDYWHDLFNALVWLTFPRTKAVLNAQHERELEARDPARSCGRRGTARDVLTLFDEGGVIVASADGELSALLTGFHWRRLFVERREAVMKRMRFHVFGHAIHEKALAPFRGITAKALVVDVDDRFLDLPLEAEVAALDASAARYFSRPESLQSTRSLSPLPVLGIPGWTAANEDPAYYDDADHFRSRRMDRREEAAR